MISRVEFKITRCKFWWLRGHRRNSCTVGCGKLVKRQLLNKIKQRLTERQSYLERKSKILQNTWSREREREREREYVCLGRERDNDSETSINMLLVLFSDISHIIFDANNIYVDSGRTDWQTTENFTFLFHWNSQITFSNHNKLLS